MAKSGSYQVVIVESFRSTNGSIRIRPVASEAFPPEMHVECSKSMRSDHPIGTRFRIRAKLTDREDGGEFLYTHYNWKYEVL